MKQQLSLLLITTSVGVFPLGFSAIRQLTEHLRSPERTRVA